VDSIQDPVVLRKPGSTENRTRNPWPVERNSDHLTTEVVGYDRIVKINVLYACGCKICPHINSSSSIFLVVRSRVFPLQHQIPVEAVSVWCHHFCSRHKSFLTYFTLYVQMMAI
jgi:hypothetical protein